MVGVARTTNRKAIDLALSTLRRLRANVLRLVLNEITFDTSDSSDGYYYHGYYRRILQVLPGGLELVACMRYRLYEILPRPASRTWNGAGK
jgi:hypothetical protein